MSDTKVICLIGASGSGKTATARELEKTGYNVIQSYTTRPPRGDDEWGLTFIRNSIELGGIGSPLVELHDLDSCKSYPRSNMIAYFNSYESGHHYFATDGQVIRGRTNIYVVDAKGAEQVHEFYKGTDVEVVTIYLQADERERMNRLYNRVVELKLDIKNYSSQLNRLIDDKHLFEIVKCDYVVDGNQSLNKVVGLVENIIKNLDGGGERS